MPLLDHFRPPLSPKRPWESFHATWIVYTMEDLNERWLPDGYYADVHTHNPRIEIDVATYQDELSRDRADTGTSVATAPARVWTPPVPAITTPVTYHETFEVRVYSEEKGALLVAAIELVSPSNKDRPEDRKAFVATCASYVTEGVSVVVVDVVTNRHFNLHNDLMQLMEAKEETLLPNGSSLYAVAYRPTIREEREEMDLWPHSLALGEPLPTMPLRLTGDLFVPVELETTYKEACRRLRLV